MKVGDVVGFNCGDWSFKVKLTEDLGDRFVYQTVNAAVGFEADAPKGLFVELPPVKRKRKRKV